MTRELNNDNGLQDWKTEHQAVTGGIFYCRDSADFSVCASNKLSCILTVKCFEIGNKNIPPIRYVALYKMKHLIFIIISLLSITSSAQIPSMCNLTYKDSLYWWHDTIYSGQIIQYYDDGKIGEKGQIKNGVPDSVWFDYNKKGKLKFVYAFYKGLYTFDWDYTFRENPFFYGIPNYPYYQFDRNGTLILEGNYVNGVKDGVWKEYYSNGQNYIEKTFDNGELQYPYYYWDIKGVKYTVGGSYVTKNGIIIFTTFKKTKIK